MTPDARQYPFTPGVCSQGSPCGKTLGSDVTPGIDSAFSTNKMLIHPSCCLQAKLQSKLEQLMTALTRKVLWRLGWLTVLGMHFPLAARLIGAAGRGESVSVISLALIGLSMAVFTAEIIWCPLLSICSSRRRFIVMLMIIALVHTGMIESPDDLLWISSTLSSFSIVLAVAFVLAAIDLRKIPHASARSYVDRWLSSLPPAWPRSYRAAHPSHAPPAL